MNEKMRTFVVPSKFVERTKQTPPKVSAAF